MFIQRSSAAQTLRHLEPIFILRCGPWGVAVGMPVARHPPRRSVRALVSAHGSYLGCVWRQSELVDTDEGCTVQGSIAGRVARSATCSAGAGRSDGVTTTASDGSPARETARGCNCSPVRHDS